MSNSVFHNIYEKNVANAYANIAEETVKTFSTLYTANITTVISTFKWGGKDFPKIPKFMPERSLMYFPMLAGFMDGEDFKIFPCFGSGAIRDDGEFDRYTIVTYKGNTFFRNREEISLCYNNSLCIPSIFSVRELTQKMSNALQAVDCALERSMLPAIIECEDEETFKKMSSYYDAEKNKLPFRLTYRGDGISSTKGTTVNDLFDSKKYDVLQMWDVAIRYRNLFYTMNGVNNVEIQKRERLTEAEGSGNDEITRYTALKDKYERRLDFIEETKAKFGKELTIEINRDSATVYNLELDNEEKIEGVELNLTRGANLPKSVNDTKEENDGDDGVQ